MEMAARDVAVNMIHQSPELALNHVFAHLQAYDLGYNAR